MVKLHAVGQLNVVAVGNSFVKRQALACREHKHHHRIFIQSAAHYVLVTRIFSVNVIHLLSEFNVTESYYDKGCAYGKKYQKSVVVPSRGFFFDGF